MKLADIKPYSNNANKNHNIEAIKHSLENYGQQTPLVLDQDNVIIKGHGTFFSMQELGWKECDVRFMKEGEKVKINGKEKIISKEMIAQFRIADNTSADQSYTDIEIVNLEIEELGLNVEELKMEGLILEINESYEEKNKEVDLDDLEKGLNAECPKCGFKFKQDE